jgi:hypothetical protein
VLVATSEVDAAASATIKITLLPSSNGTVRIDTGSATPTTDGNGNSWASDPGIQGLLNVVGSDYPAWKSQDPLRAIYESSVNSEHDLRYRIGVPNGNYLIHLLFGTPYNGCGSAADCGPQWISNNRYNIYTYNPQLITTQGNIQSHQFNFGAAINYAYATPADVYVPARVTNNILDVGIFSLAPEVGTNTAPLFGHKVNELSGLEILPDHSAPRWAIDASQGTEIAPGGSMQLYVVDYYTGSTASVWSVVSGPGLIGPGGLLTIPAGAASGTAVIVKAASQTNSQVSAEITLCVNSCSPTGAKIARVNPAKKVLRTVERFVVFLLKEVKRGLARLA